MTLRILVTGSRNWTDRTAIFDALVGYLGAIQFPVVGQAVLVSGSCPTGADRIAEEIWEDFLGYPVERHPADWDAHGKAAGPRRNQQMVDLGADVCLAFPLPDSRGTKHCMAAAERAGIPVQVFTPEVTS